MKETKTHYQNNVKRRIKCFRNIHLYDVLDFNCSNDLGGWNLKCSQRRHCYLKKTYFLINIFRELKSTFIDWLNLNKILWEILASVTTNTLLEFNFLFGIQLTMKTHLWCHQPVKICLERKNFKIPQESLIRLVEISPICSQILHLTECSLMPSFPASTVSHIQLQFF